ncbi:MAG: hypothetical protein V3S43_06250 [Acidimicrobiia bacterium]
MTRTILVLLITGLLSLMPMVGISDGADPVTGILDDPDPAVELCSRDDRFCIIVDDGAPIYPKPTKRLQL